MTGKFYVGAALMTENNTIILGCNIESKAYPTTICAERVAIFSALSQGHLKYKALALVTKDGAFPCGSCRQIIYEYRLSAWFGSLEMNREFSHSLEKVSVFTPDGLLRIKSDQLTFSGQQSLHDTAFLSWKSKASDTNRLSFKISNIPAHSLQYTGIPVVILFLLFAAVALFLRTRLLKNIHSGE